MLLDLHEHVDDDNLCAPSPVFIGPNESAIAGPKLNKGEASVYISNRLYMSTCACTAHFFVTRLICSN